MAWIPDWWFGAGWPVASRHWRSVPHTEMHLDAKKPPGISRRIEFAMNSPGECLSGGVLLSHTVAGAVPSALKGLASGFGMGPGVSPSLWPP